MIEYITDSKVLEGMAHLNLEERAVAIKDKFGLSSKFSGRNLLNYYKKNGVYYLIPKYAYSRKEARADILKSERRIFSKELALMMMEDENLVYIDETSIHKWLMKKKVWLKRTMELKMPDTRGPSFTIIAGIGHQRGLIHFNVIQGSNNQNTFTQFLQGLKIKMNGKATLVLDNLTVHHASKVKTLFDDNFKPFYLPAYSCELNPIERLWSVVKAQWRKLMLIKDNQRLDETKELNRIT